MEENGVKNISITEINRSEALRYLYCKDESTVSETASAYLDECEKRLLEVIAPKYRYRCFDIKSISENGVTLDGCSLILSGKDAAAHLEGCGSVIVMCATVGAGADRLIRIMQIEDMAKAVITDAFASAAVEDVCNKAEDIIKKEFEGKFFTWRFSPGYGDMPIEMQKNLLDVLDAPRKIGLCTADSMVLMPTKSVTAVIGVSDSELPKKRRGCISCGMKDVCRFRKRGIHCEL